MYCKDRHVFASIYLHNSVWLLNKYQNILRMGIGKEESKNFKGYVGKTLRKIKEIYSTNSLIPPPWRMN